MLTGAVLAAEGTFLTVAGLLCALLLLVPGSRLALSVALTGRLLTTLPENGFGLVTGYSDEPDPGNPALTPWLADLLDRLAGKQGGDALTFGDSVGQPGSGRRARRSTWR